MGKIFVNGSVLLRMAVFLVKSSFTLFCADSICVGPGTNSTSNFNCSNLNNLFARWHAACFAFGLQVTVQNNFRTTTDIHRIEYRNIGNLPTILE